MATVDGNETVEGEVPPPTESNFSPILMSFPNNEHMPDRYNDLELEFSPSLFSSLEKYLPPDVLSLTRDEKLQYMLTILLKYLPRQERLRAKRHRDYRERIRSCYQPLNKELYTLDFKSFFVPSFLKAINGNTQDIISEPSPGVFVFDMFQPGFCEMMLSELENFRKWVKETNFQIVPPNTMNKYGAVLGDFGLDSMLKDLVKHVILPIAKVFFLDVCETLDSHHGFVVEYGEDSDSDLGFHVDDSEVTLNVCLGKEFVGGDLYFRGTRCEDHVNTDTKSEETFDYCHIPGKAVLHRGRHRHGARATTSGRRVNMILWCKSSVFREMRNFQKDLSNWCGECSRLKAEMRSQRLAVNRKDLIRTKAGYKA